MEGRLNFDLIFTETLTSPKIQTEFDVTDGQYLHVPFERFSGRVELDESTINWEGALSKSASDSLFESSGTLPVDFSLSPFAFQFLRNDSLEVKFNARGLDLAILQAFAKSVQNIQGKLVADIVLSNTFADLRGVGPIRVVDGHFDVPELGTKYRDVNLAFILQGKELIIRDFRLKSGGGRLSLVEGGLSLSEQALKDFNAKFKASGFQLINNKKMRATVRGNIDISGSVQAPYFSGELNVTESRIYYPAWLEEDVTVELSKKPFFVIDTDSVRNDTLGAIRFQKRAKEPEASFTESRFYRNLRGELALIFPRNTWIRSSDTNIEVQGELVFVKEENAILLFGSLSTIRGYYELLGNRFQIESGDLVFHGEPEPDPEVDIEAVYEFRDMSGADPQKREFRVFVTGTFSTPQFRFTLDGQVAKQEDVLSILIFGQSSESLTFSQRSSVSDDAGLGERAQGLVTGQLLKQVTGKLGEELRLDVVQIESGQDLEETRLRIGKYITPDVFISISQDFGDEGNRKVELEYEIPKKLLFFNLLLQASQERKGDSGLDVIWKIEW